MNRVVFATQVADASLTPALRSMLKRVAAHNGRLLLLSVTESGGNAARLVRTLIDIGLVETCTHPNAKHSNMAALRLTTKGTEAARELK
jgi:hypothetical protein